MLSTTLSRNAVQRLRHGIPWVPRDDVVRVEGVGAAGEPAELLDEEGRRLGVGDVDLSAPVAVRRLGLPEDRPQTVVSRMVRRAFSLRARFMRDARFCRVVNDDGDGLPGLSVDRFDTHFAVQTSTRAMDARLPELVRVLVEAGGAESIILRNDGPQRVAAGLNRSPPKVLFGRPPRWTAVRELGARMTIDLHQGFGTGHRYDLRQVRKVVGRMASGARVLEPSCGVGSLFIHAALAGARQLVAFDEDPDAIALALENAEANGFLGRTTLEVADAVTALEQRPEPFDLVLLDTTRLSTLGEPEEEDAFVGLTQLCIRHTRHGGYLLLVGYHPPLPPGLAELDERVALACEREGRVAYRLARPGLPFDFPTAVGSTWAEHLSAAALEVT
ncbi:MAG: class I SAM-dependent rRNA methyltransferase [Myxococcota bacterium]